MIFGVINDELGTPISGAIITIIWGTAPFRDIAAISNEKGEYQLSGVELGSYEISVIHTSYKATSVNLDILGATSNEVNITLKKSVEKEATRMQSTAKKTSEMQGETEECLLSQDVSLETQVALNDEEGHLRSSYRPHDAESEIINNPVPAQGYIEVFRVGQQLETLEGELRQAPDGRYYLVPDESEVVIGPDDRVRVQRTTAWPYPVHGNMKIRFPNGKVFIGSGTMVGRRHVLTAGHCVYSRADGGWASDVVFSAAQNDSTLPFGSVKVSRVFSVPQWTSSEDRNWDMGMLILSSDLGQSTGFYGISRQLTDAELHKLKVNITGYPGDKGGKQMWTHADAIKNVSGERLSYDLDTFGGQSGSAIWTIFGGREMVVGIHTSGSQSGNGGTRLTESKLQIIHGWLEGN